MPTKSSLTASLHLRVYFKPNSSFYWCVIPCPGVAHFETAM